MSLATVQAVEAPIPVSVLWQLLAGHPRAGLHTINYDGKILFANVRSIRIYLDGDPEPHDIVGQTLHELFPPAFADERLAMIQRIIDGGVPRLIRTFWRGQQYYVASFPHTGPDGETMDRQTSVVHDCGGGNPLDWSLEQFGEVLEPNVVTLGPFASLTRQELVVLALLGNGLTMKQAAAQLHRSVKTIQAHRDRIGQKLNVADRGELIAMVQNAGLKPSDARRLRLDEWAREQGIED